jgi:FKBP-type peptidyl-prolyl cis-trans isomerase (trigger factor)
MTKESQTKKATTSALAKTDDGTIQITFTVPYSEIKKSQEEVIEELKPTIEVPGFRKGRAPNEKILESISQNMLFEKTLSKILPALVADAIKEYKIQPVIYPKFELIKANENEDWQIRATTCELPEIVLGDYKKDIQGKFRAKNLWVPGKEEKATGSEGLRPGGKESTREEKEHLVLKSVLESVKVKIPKILVDEEVNSRLSKLLERLEKLGLSLESYLSSAGKTPEVLRSEYEKQSSEALAIDLALSEIAVQEKINVDQKEVDAAIEAAKADPKLAEELATPERRKFIEVILRRRKALGTLLSLTK